MNNIFKDFDKEKVKREQRKIFSIDLFYLLSCYLTLNEKEAEKLKIIFQRWAENTGSLEYSSIFLKELTGDSRQRLDEIKADGKVNDKDIIQLIVVEGILKALELKKIYTEDGKPERGLVLRIDNYKEYINVMEKLNNDNNVINSEYEIFTGCDEDKKEEIKKAIYDRWKEYRNIIDKVYKDFHETKIKDVLEELLYRLPQQSSDTGLYEEIFMKEYPVFGQSLEREFIKSKFWENYKEKKANKNEQIVYSEWLDYNVITNIEFYFYGGPLSADSWFINYPLFRHGKKFGFLIILKEKDKQEELFNSLVKNRIRKSIDIVGQFIPSLVSEYHHYLENLFQDNLRKDVIEDIASKKPDLDYLTEKFIAKHNKERLVASAEIERGRDGISETEWFEIEKSFARMLELQDSIIRAQNPILRSAAATILIESYAHNIGAHSLEGLKMAFHREQNKDKNGIKYDSLYEYMKYLQGKSAFWNAISRGGVLFGGNSISLWKLVDGFARNNLLCGSLGASEKVDGIEFHLYINHKNPIKFTSSLSNYTPPEEQDIVELREYDVFLPEGVVGQQAVYTIWENIVRNIKHCKVDQNSSIPFHIEFKVEEEYIIIKNWIEWEQKKKYSLDESIEKSNNWAGLLDSSMRPNMGGTSQNILCAGMLSGLDFLEAQEMQLKERKDNNRLYQITKIVNDSKEYFSQEFKIWRSKENIEWIENSRESESGPKGRYKIFTVSNENKQEFQKARPGIRYIINYE